MFKSGTLTFAIIVGALMALAISADGPGTLSVAATDETPRTVTETPVAAQIASITGAKTAIR